MARSGKLKIRKKITVSLSPEVHAALTRLSELSGVSCSRLLDDFLSYEVIDSISDGIQAARDGRNINDIASGMSAVVGRHVLAASEVLQSFSSLRGDKVESAK